MGNKNYGNNSTYHYRVGDAFYDRGINENVAKKVTDRFPDSLMGSYLSQTTDKNAATLSEFLKDHCESKTYENYTDGYDCLVALRTGDVLSTTGKKTHLNKLPRSPTYIADTLQATNCINSLFVTGKHSSGRGTDETNAFLRDLGAEMDARSLKHDIKLTENNTTDDVDKDMCALVTFKNQFFRGSGGFHQVIGDVRTHRNQPSSLNLVATPEDSICVDVEGKYRHACTPQPTEQ